jgi:hypothetical protein
MRKAMLFIVATAVAVVVGCEKSGGGGGGEPPGGGVAPGQGNPTPAAAPTIGLEGVPDALSNAQELDVTVVSTSSGTAAATSYMFGILTDEDDCKEVEYGEFVDIDEKVTADLGEDGEKTLCVLARNASGIMMTTAVSATWTKDTAAPTAVLTGVPKGESNQTALSVKVKGDGDGLVSYAYEVVSGDECESLASAKFVSIDKTLETTVTVADGTTSLCVAGKDAVGNIQNPPTKATWTKDTIAPVAVISGMPTAPSKLTSITATVAGTDDDGLVSYAYAAVAGDTCASLTAATFTAKATGISTDVTALADGTVTLCVAGKDTAGNIQDPPSEVSWTKDTVAPTVAISFSRTAFGPGTTSGDTTSITGTATDVTTSVTKVQFSVQADDRSDGCLNEAGTGFVATCPNWIDVDSGTTSWSFAVDDDILAHGHTYSVSARGHDQADNVSAATTTASAATWDTVAPVIAGADLTVTEQAAQLALSWDAVGGASGYVVVRKASSAPTFTPVDGTAYTTDATVASGEVAAYVGTATSFIDDGLTPDTAYYYALFAYDGAGNYSSATTGNGTARASFRGITRAYVVGPGRTIGVDWQPVDDGVNDLEDYTFSAYAATTAAGQSFSSATASVTGGRNSVAFTAPGSGTDSSYVVVRASVSGGSSDTNTVEHGGISFASGAHHKLTGLAIHNGTVASQALNPAANTAIMRALALDRWGNQLYSASYGSVAVRCQENQGAPYCRGRKTDSVYTLIGSDWVSDADDGVAPGSAVGGILAIGVDRRGNVYFSDTYYRVRVQCNFIGTSGGYCAGKTPGLIYRLIGTGSYGFPTNGATASTSGIGYIYGITVDDSGNVALADTTNDVVLALCYDTSGTMCSGKTANTVNWIVGDTTGGDGADGASAIAAGIGSPNGIARDSHGNIYIADSSFDRVRVLCLVASGPACTGKTTGMQYRVAGSSVNTDDEDGVATSTSIGDPYGIGVDGNGNVYVTDTTNARTRAICLDTTDVGGFCEGATAGNVYRMSGIGSATDGVDGSALDNGHGYLYSIGVDSGGNVYAVDHTAARLRALCHAADSSGYCSGRSYGNQYRMTATYYTSAATMLTARPARGVSFVNMKGVDFDSAGNVYVADTDGYSVYGIYALCYDVSTSGTYCTNKTRGYMYRMLSGSTTPATTGTAFSSSRIIAPYALTVDPFNNVIVADNYYTSVFALCVTTSGGFCSGKTAAKAYRIAGQANNGGTTAPASSGASATSGDFADVRAMTSDSLGNVFLVPYASHRMWALCTDVSTPSPNINFCSAKTAGSAYYVAGDGTAQDGTDDVSATGGTGRFGSSYGMDVDAYNNIFFTDDYYMRVRAVCNNTVGGFCAGGTQDAGSSYRIAGLGNGQVSDGTNGATRNGGSDGLGSLTGLAVDPSGNVFIMGNTNTRIRVICLNTTSGYCSSKAADKVYHWVGSGTLGDGRSNQAASTSLTIGSSPSADTLAIHPTTGDIILGDDSYDAIRWFKGY